MSVPERSKHPTIRIIKYSANEFVEKELWDVDDIRGWLDQESVVWVDINGLGDVTAFQRLSEVFGLHHLALEDALNSHQRPKVEEYEDHLFIVLKIISLTERLEIAQANMFLGEHYVLTIHEQVDDCFDPVRVRLRESRGLIRKEGADYLAYALVDAITDCYFPVVDSYGERLETLDEQIAGGHSNHMMEAIHDIRSDISALRRAVRPLRDAIIQIQLYENSLFQKETHYHLRDCYDHTIQILDLLENYRELCTNLREYHMATVSNRLNEVMKVLTITGTVFIPLTFIAGVYGMNFNTSLPGNMPELNWPYGYAFVWLLMLATGLCLLAFVWSKGWLFSDNDSLGRTEREREQRDDAL